jgi:cobalt-zinc-cadmium efflux system outer membrane protein
MIMTDKRVLKKVSILIFSFSFLAFHLANGQSLQDYLKIAEKNNPEIQKFELQYKIVSEKTNEVNTLPNTEIGVGYFVSEPETRTGAQRFKLSAKQMIPWFGSITARENYISSLADAKYEDVVIAKRKLMASVSQSYYNLYAIQRKQEVLKENISLLETYVTLALTAVEVGKASAVTVLKLQMRQNELEQLRQVLEQQYLAEQTAFNKLLNRAKNVLVQVVAVLSIPLESELINSESLVLHPELTKYDKLYQSVTQSELLNQKESNPMLGFGLDYIAVSKRPNMNFDDNGKDIIMPMLSISIPIFNKKFTSKSKQNQLKQQEITFQKQERLNTLETVLERAIKNRISAKIKYNTQAKNIQQAKNAEQLLIRSYETGIIDFNDVLDIQELQLKFQINQIESLKTYYKQTTIINYLSI